MSRFNILIILALSAALSALGAVITIFENFSTNSFIVKALLIPALFPYEVFSWLYSFGSHDVEGAALGAGIILTILGPAISFVFWFIILLIVFGFVRILKKRCLTKDKKDIRREISLGFFYLIIGGVVLFVVTLNIVTFYHLTSWERKSYAEFHSRVAQERIDYAKSIKGIYYQIGELGIKLKLPSEIQDLIYEVRDRGGAGKMVLFSTRSLDSHTGCEVSKAPLGILEVFTKREWKNNPNVYRQEGLHGRILLDEEGPGLVWYHLYNPYRLGDYYFVYVDSLAPSYVSYPKHVLDSLDYEGPCSTEQDVANLQKQKLQLLHASLRTITLIDVPEY